MRRGLMLRYAPLLAVHLWGCVTVDAVSGPFHGQIVDDHSEQPIEGAIVLAVWRTAVDSPIGHPTAKFYDAREVLTNQNGRFSLPALSEAIWKLSVQPPILYFFAAGYLRPPYHYRHSRTSGAVDPSLAVSPVDGRPFLDPTIVTMRRILTKQDWCRYRLMYSPSRVGIPESRMPLFASALRSEQRTRGICTSLIQ